MDRLGDAVSVVAEQGASAVDDRGRAPVVDREVVAAGAGKEIGVVDQPRGGGACVAVDGLVIVADPEHVGLGPCQQPHQQHMGRGEILELVDEHDLARPSGGSPSLGISAQDLDGAEDLLVEVEEAMAGQGLAVSRDDGGKVTDIAAELLLDHLRRPQAEPGRGERFEIHRHRIGHHLTAGRDELVEQAADVRFVDHLGAGAGSGPGERGPTGDDRERQRIERADLETGKVVGALLHLGASTDVERKQADGCRIDAAIVDQVAGPFGEHGGLARTGRCDDAGARTTVHDGGELIGSESARGGASAEWSQRPDAQIGERHDRCAVGFDGDPVERTAIAPDRTVGADDVARTVDDGLGSGSDREVDCVDRRALRIARIDRVGEHEVPQRLAFEIGVGREMPIVDREGRVGGRELATELDHDRLSGEPMGAQLGDGVGSVVLDDDPWSERPWFGHRLPGCDHQIAAECHRPGEPGPVDVEGDARHHGRRSGSRAELRRWWRRVGRRARASSNLGHRRVAAAAVATTDHGVEPTARE